MHAAGVRLVEIKWHPCAHSIDACGHWITRLIQPVIGRMLSQQHVRGDLQHFEGWDAEGYSMWFCKYKYPEENTVNFIVMNKVRWASAAELP